MLRDCRIFRFLLFLNRCLFALYHYLLEREKQCMAENAMDIDAKHMDIENAAVSTAGEADTTADADGDLND